MAARTYGYARVSTRQQSEDRQVIDLLAAGVDERDLCIDHGVSGSRTDRPALNNLLPLLRDGDTLVVATLDRLGRSARHMLELADTLQSRGVTLRVLNLGGGVVDTSQPMGAMLFTIMSALAQMELDIKRERINDSIEKRRTSGGNLGGRPRSISDDLYYLMERDLAAGQPVAAVCRQRGVSRSAYYREKQRRTAPVA